MGKARDEWKVHRQPSADKNGLPIVMPWRVMTTISAFGPAGSEIGAARGSAEAAPVLGATVRPASTGRFSRLFDGLAAILPAWVTPGREVAGLTSEDAALRRPRC